MRAMTAHHGLRLSALSLVLLSLVACSKGEKSGADPNQKRFGSPEEAADSLVAAAERKDVDALKAIFGRNGQDLVVTGDPVQDRNQCSDFVAQARQKMHITRDDPKVAVVNVGAEDWPLPIPIVQDGNSWRFDSEAGRQELLARRIGNNELDAIEICRGFVEAEHEYASTKHDGAEINQYAQQVISRPGKHDGLAWQDPDSTWNGPVGENIARAMAEGYKIPGEPYHGYFYKVLKGQGPAARMGEMDFLVKGAMIGGFALVAAPAEYGVTGVKTFMVSHEGVVYESDLGPDTVQKFRAMERYNPDSTWTPVPEEAESAAAE